MSRRGRIRLWVLDRLPDWLVARPEGAFLAFLCFGSGIPTLLGAAESGALAALMPTWFIRLWGAALVLGSASTAWGLTSIRYQHGRELVPRAAWYKLGLRVLYTASLVYAAAILYVGQARALPAAGFVAPFVFVCWVRLSTLQAAEEIRSRRGGEVS